jgi:CubicO group peptidase (beta-lactamase class C family)
LKEFKRADFNTAGLFGHSMGGGASVHACAETKEAWNAKACVGLHPWVPYMSPGEASKVKLPIMYTTGSSDHLVPAVSVKGDYNKVTTSKVYASLKGAGHTECMDPPLGKGRMTPYVIAFFDCHLKKNATACDKVCNRMKTDLDLSDFDSKCGSSPPPSPPTPSPPPSPPSPSPPTPPSPSEGPGSGPWDVVTPESVGLDRAALKTADQEISRTSKQRNCLVIIKDGKLAYESYSDSKYNSTAHDAFSMTKTLGAMIMLRLQTLGKIDIDKDITQAYGVKSPKPYPVTSRHIMTQSLNGNRGPGQSFAYDAFGSRWINRLPTIVKKATGKDAAHALEEMKKVLGLSDVFKWPLVDEAWNGESFGTCRDYARFGQLMLNKGAWKGQSSPYITEDLMEQMVTPQKFGSYGYSNPCYGLLTWLNGDKSKYPGTCEHAYPNIVDRGQNTFLKDAPYDISMALGLNGEVVMVMPSQNTVVVSMGTTTGFVEVVRRVYPALCKALGACGSPPSPPSPPTPPSPPSPPSPTPPAPPSPSNPCGVMETCWQSMTKYCTEGGGASCMLCLVPHPLSSCGGTLPTASATSCFCNRHDDDTAAVSELII